MLCTGITCCFLAFKLLFFTSNIMPISNDACWVVGKFSHILSNAGEKILSYSHYNITISCKQEKQDVAWCLNIYWTNHASYLQCAGCVCVGEGGGGAGVCVCVEGLWEEGGGLHLVAKSCVCTVAFGVNTVNSMGLPLASLCWLFPSQHFKCL